MIGYGLPEQNELIQAACQETGLEKHRVKVYHLVILLTDHWTYLI